jgi:isopentenyl-diphosphate delta-isomerase
MTAVNKGHVIVVNEQDEWLGTMEKIKAHKEGILHRAFSVFVLNSSGQLLLQQRATAKYHTGGLWSNTCCSHPIPTESTLAGSHRRLMEEMGFDCDLKEIFTLRYKAIAGEEMTENEYDHIYFGYYDGAVTANTAEVSDYMYVTLTALDAMLLDAPEAFTPWLHLAMPKFKAYLSTQQVTL